MATTQRKLAQHGDLERGKCVAVGDPDKLSTRPPKRGVRHCRPSTPTRS